MEISHILKPCYFMNLRLQKYKVRQVVKLGVKNVKHLIIWDGVSIS